LKNFIGAILPYIIGVTPDMLDDVEIPEDAV
jgi:hypothetical protein